MAHVPPPSKIVCVGRSFRAHANELGNAVPDAPIFFLKAPSAVIGPGDAIRVPPSSQLVHHEAEAAVVVGRRLSQASIQQAEAAIAAWTVLNDVTARDLQRADKGRFTRAKGFDTFCPLSDVRLSPIADWAQHRIQGWVNDECRQDAPLGQLIWTPFELLAYISSVMTLLPGDIVSLGTPAGVGPLVAGDVVDVRLIGPDGAIRAGLRNPVV
jgi:2-keto-4-pentenoate hydratase/2-oxohepta-3-ene-1,7-dioic acid hydratase in catechol pathway